ncbi:TadE/TadG family type IV pilus assembly protein [Arthrobacter sp. H5]|uniref:TadE/TadG family type IV pilus assembly protein n=1 Tax=Arthrobacter sp. H5 TaxID=1267973 RepID=UPI000485AADC|nr:TadE/TadG family type IV pilus assembly protein [Arthrobacter sp. H5]
MRRLGPTKYSPRLRLSENEHERGAVSVIVAFLLVVLLGFAALAVDVGAMYSEKAQLQNGADASALAIASDCAQGACGDVFATGRAYANGNANDDSSGIQSITFPDTTTVRVETNARDASTGADHFSLYFARAMGFNETEIDASAEAAWGAPSAGNTLPWTISQCVFEQFLSPSQLSELNSTGSFTGDPTATPILMRYDKNTPDYPGCVAQNGYNPGGFGWLETTGSGCTADIDIAATVEGQPGNNFPNEADCVALLASFMDEPALIPLFTTATGNGGNAIYSLTGFAAFQVTAYKFGGGSSVSSDPPPAGCSRNCRGIEGFFTRYVSLAEGMTLSGSVPDFGVTSVSLSG